MIGSLIGKMADAQKMSIAQIQQSIASGSLPSYIGIPLLQEKAQQAQKLQMAQAILKEQGTPDVTVKDQVMQAADQVTRPEPPVMPSTPDGYRQQPAPSQGVESLASNMPEEYAGGGIIAFADRGAVPGVPDDIIIPGRDSDEEDLRAAGNVSLREAPVRGREGRSYRDLEAITPYGVDRPVSGNYEPYTPPTESYGDTLSRLGSGVKDFLSSTIEPMGGESEGAMRRRLARESYYDTTTPPPSMRNLGVTPIAGGISVLPKDAFTPSSMREEAPPAGPWAMDKVLGTTPERGIDSAPGARPPAGRDGIRLTPGVEIPQAPKMPEFPSFEGLEKSYGDYISDSRSRRQKLEDMILGQQADRPERERQNRATSLMEAGFGMMAGESPFAGVNIGRGAMAGARSYAKGIEQLHQDDAKVVSQLASLGLRGEELEQQAMKYGIDIQKMKAELPHLQAQTAETMARIPGLGLEPYVKRAQIGQMEAQTGLLGSETRYKDVATELLPIEAATKRLNALRKMSQDRPGSIPAKDIRELETVLLPSIMDSPLGYAPLAAEIEGKYPDLAKGLSQDKDSPEFKKARAAIAPFVRQYIDGLKQEIYENAPTRRGSDYGYSQSED